MASDYTSNYQLPIWAPEDSFLRAEFNDANQKIDQAIRVNLNNITALMEKIAIAPKIAVGDYIGTGTTSHTVQVGFNPKLFLVIRMDDVAQHLIMLGNNAEFLDEQGTIGRRLTTSQYQVYAIAQGVYLSCAYGWTDDLNSIAVCNVNGVQYIWFALG